MAEKLTVLLHLADNTKICYTYDKLSRVTKRTVYNECNEIVSEESFTYDAVGNITDAPDSCFVYDTNNRLIVFNGNTVSYDMDGNMLSNGYINCEFDKGMNYQDYIKTELLILVPVLYFLESD